MLKSVATSVAVDVVVVACSDFAVFMQIFAAALICAVFFIYFLKGELI